MDYLRQQELLKAADSIRPGLGSELARLPLASSAELDQIQALLEEHKKVMANHATLQKDYRRQGDEYRRQTAMLDAKLSSSGLAPLPPAGLAAARHLASVAGSLGLHSVSEGAMVAAWVADDAKKLQEERVQAKRSAAAADLRSAAAAAERQAGEVARALEAAGRAQSDSIKALPQKEAEWRALEQKAAGYVKKIEYMKGKLEQYGYRQELGHEALAELAAQVSSVEASLGAAREALTEYDSIPASASGLASLLEVATRELAQLEKAMGSAFVHGSSGAGMYRQ